MDVLAHSLFFWAALIMALLTLYILPTLIAAIRGTENLGWIIVLNLLPTGIGWLAALIAAATLPRREPLRQRYPQSRALARNARAVGELSARPRCAVYPELPSDICRTDDADSQFLAAPVVHGFGQTPDKGITAIADRYDSHRSRHLHHPLTDAAEPDGDARSRSHNKSFRTTT